jgi:lipopolysaccharide/colanic/teichoic acid biosynthesis glycosyltransferase
MKPTATVLDTIKTIKGEELVPAPEDNPDICNYKILLIGCAACLKIKLTASNFELSYAANIHEAKKIIESDLKNNLFFDAIICNTEIQEKRILHFAGYLSTTKTICHIPFILFTNGNKINTELCTLSQGIDDFISLETSLPDLSDKIAILKKYKFFQNRLSYSSITEPEPGITKQLILKRLVDIIFSAFALLVLSPIIIIIAICIKIESKGPVFYKSLRAGNGYKVFTFFKFRTMVANAEDMVKDLRHLNEYKDYKGSYFFKIKDDPRVTRVGQFLRKTSLDELPQLINVLKGDMSLVGNRPLPLYEACSITVDKSAKRFLAPAGITGLWQVKGRSNLNLSVDERISMDIDYAEKQSFIYDMKILFKTPKELILKNNV